jgi:hypothetical protein
VNREFVMPLVERFNDGDMVRFRPDGCVVHTPPHCFTPGRVCCANSTALFHARTGVLCKLHRTVSRPRGAVQVWVVDTELLMVPAFVGARCRSANVGFVFNTPFPSSVPPLSY